MKESAATIPSAARTTIQTIERAIAALAADTTVRSKTATAVLAAFDAGLEFTGQPVEDWRTARAVLTGTTELNDVAKQGRVLRLLKATDTLAWALTDAWDKQAAYTDAAAVVRRVLGDEAIASSRQEAADVSLMSMHRSKGKEFDGVVIFEGDYSARLLEKDWDAVRNQAERRLLRVAIPRARHTTVFVRPQDAVPLLTPVTRRQHEARP